MRLLISVVGPDEVGAALAGGADILDLKNPAEGSLGAPSPSILRLVRQAAPPPQLLSVAIGDMPDLPGTAALAAAGAVSCGADYIKIGLWGPRSEAAAVALVRAATEAVAACPGAAVIAAGYADAERAGTLEPRLLPGIALRGGAAGCLIDTAVKDGRPLFEFLAPDTLAAIVAEAHAAGLLVALAGALRAHDLPVLQELDADIAGVRSAACQDGRRGGPLQAWRVRELRALLDAPAPARTSVNPAQTIG
jgi:hypothetical protein